MEEEEFVDYVKTLHEQNLNGREDFLQAFEKGIRAAYEELQQPEVEIESATIAKLWNAKHCDEIRDILKEFSNSILNQHEYNLSTLTQDKVREAAERVVEAWKDRTATFERIALLVNELEKALTKNK